MSGEEDFLKRWSRRKREVAEADKPKAPAAQADTAGGPATQPKAGLERGPAIPEFDPSTLPPIESITAISDVTAFLRAGVPAELTRAALRRVWMADPSIREFIGLAENAWDFTDPTAMPGFGPLEATDEVRRMIAQVVDQIGQSPQSVASNASIECQHGENLNDTSAITANRKEPSVPEPPTQIEQPRQDPAQTFGDQVLMQRSKENIALQHETTKPAEPKEKPKQFSGRTHGGALPQ